MPGFKCNTNETNIDNYYLKLSIHTFLKSKITNQERTMKYSKNIINTSIYAILGLLFMISCDSINGTKDDDSTDTVKTEITAEQIENPDNPYDDTGETHNDFLDFFIEQAESNKNKGMDTRQVVRIVENFYAANDARFTDEEYKAYSNLIDTMNSIGIKPGWPNISAEICKYIPTLCDGGSTGPYNPAPSFDALNNDDGVSSTDAVLKHIEQSIASEERLMANEDDKEKEVKLSEFSVARYSAAYWHNTLVQGKENDKGYYDSLVEAQEICGDCIVRADAMGVLVGLNTPGLTPHVTSAIFSIYALLDDMINGPV